jgi:hypothetical protein
VVSPLTVGHRSASSLCKHMINPCILFMFELSSCPRDTPVTPTRSFETNAHQHVVDQLPLGPLFGDVVYHQVPHQVPRQQERAHLCV